VEPPPRELRQDDHVPRGVAEKTFEGGPDDKTFAGLRIQVAF
jgi:hypothetical protein